MMDVRKREDQMLDAMSVLHRRRNSAFMRLTLWEYAYPEMRAFCRDVRDCLEGADSDS